MTVGLLVDKLKVKNKTKKKTLGNIVPDCWIYVQDRSVTLGRIQIFNNWSPYMVDEPDKKVWLGLEYFCDEGDGMWTSDDFAFIQNAVKELVEIGVIESENAVLDSTLLRVKKAYPAYFGSYKDFELVKAWLNDVDNLWCIGRNGQHRYNNMDHSMATAMLACERIIRGETDKEAVWNVNTEKSYHETKGRGRVALNVVSLKDFLFVFLLMQSQVLSEIYFYIEMPYGCTMDFRYIMPMILALALTLGYVQKALAALQTQTARRLDLWLTILTCIFLASSVLFYCVCI